MYTYLGCEQIATSFVALANFVCSQKDSEAGYTRTFMLSSVYFYFVKPFFAKNEISNIILKYEFERLNLSHKHRKRVRY